MHELRETGGMRGGFVHVPFEPDQVPPGSDLPSLAPEQTARALAVVVSSTLGTMTDFKVAAGATH